MEAGGSDEAVGLGGQGVEGGAGEGRWRRGAQRLGEGGGRWWGQAGGWLPLGGDGEVWEGWVKRGGRWQDGGVEGMQRG
ncbi:hypothetical protein B1218_37585, partial [Pseudomonas ogarae]